MPKRDSLVGKKFHSSSLTATHKEDNQKSTSCNKFVTQLLPYVHATGLANFNRSIRNLRITTECSVFLTDSVFHVLFAYFDESMASIGGYEPYRSWNTVGLTQI